MANYSAPGSGIACPKCGHLEQTVRDSRPNCIGVGRRRRCASCDHAFTTQEIVVDPVQPLIVSAGWTSRPKVETVGDFLRRLQDDIHQSVVAAFAKSTRTEEIVHLDLEDADR